MFSEKPDRATSDVARFESVLAAEVHELLVQWLRRGLGVGIVLYAGFSILDYYSSSSELGFLIAVRLVVVLLAAITIGLSYAEKAQPFLGPISVLMLYVAASGIAIMTPRVGGFESHYYFGILLVLFFVGLFMPWRLPTAVLFCFAVAVTYLLANAYLAGLNAAAVPAFFYVVSTCVFTCLAVEAGDRSRRRDLSLRLRLEQANDELKKLDEAKTRFFANVSHELRTPLTLMVSPVETMLRDERNPEKRTLLRAALANSRRLLRHVNLLLDTAKLEAGQMQLDVRPGDLAALLTELVQASLPHAGRKGIELTTEGLNDLPVFAFDSAKVEMIAANLLSNALKFTPDGGRIVVRARADDSAMVFEVSDSGPGIPPGQEEAIFDRFHQVDSSLTRSEEGTGLGLALARELARLQGGDVEVESVAGQGSTFRVTLPREALTPEERRQAPRRREDKVLRARAEVLANREFGRRSQRDTLLADVRGGDAAGMGGDGTGPPERLDRDATVLVVEDNSDLRSYLVGQLSRHYKVETAIDGVEGLKKALAIRPDLVLSDIMMPKMNGYELCRRLRTEPMLKGTPIILVTAKAGSEAAVEGLDTGADDYVTKPFSMEELEARIGAQIRARRTERRLGERETRLAAIGSLTSTVVHDLRNALMLIKGYSDLARAVAVGGGPKEDLVEDIDQVRAAATRLETMATEILEFARGAGTELKKAVLPASTYLVGVLAPLRTNVARHGVELVVEDRLESAVEVELDPDRFTRVLENLVSNAQDAVSGKQERLIVVELGSDETFLRVRVADNGAGIEEERLGSLFDPFSTGKKKGTGLGLATVRNLVKAHGGEVTVEGRSELGGAAFVVSVPLDPGPGAAPSPAADAEPAAPVAG